ncbi:MAG: hypothetical protein M3X11_18090 [Acidobacteriota bacterium]|nr:hypothetical protein [Acidobacteriota bacterium]
MSAKMKSACEGCGGEVLFEKDSTGQEIIEANPDEYTKFCGACRTKQRQPETESSEEGQRVADFEDEHNKAMRTGGTSDQAAY